MIVRTTLLAAVALLVACGDSDSDAGGGGAGAGGGSGGTTSTNMAEGGGGGDTPEMCIQPGDVGNETGVGTYCTPGGGECSELPTATLCLADVGQDEWFCTRIGCDETTDCGDGAGCLLNDAGSACVPCHCDDEGIGCGEGGAGTGGAG